MSDYLNQPFLQAETQTVNFTSTQTAAQIQALIDVLPKYIPFGSTITLQFGNGTYSSLAGQVNITGFYGGGTLNVQGNTAETDATILHTTQDVHLDLTGDAITGLFISNCAVVVNVLNLRITCDDGFRCIWALWSGVVAVKFGYFSNVAKTNSLSTGIYMQSCLDGNLQANYVSNNYGGIWANTNISIISTGNDDTGTAPNYGLRATSNATLGKNGTQPAGTTANELSATAGVIR